MTFPTALSTTLPGDNDDIDEGALRIRQLASAVRERLAALMVNVDTNPPTLRAGLLPSGYAITAPAFTGGTHANGTFNNPTFSGTITGLPSSNPTVQSASRATTLVLTLNTWTTVLSFALTTGTWLIVATYNGIASNSSAGLIQNLARIRNGAATIVGRSTDAANAVLLLVSQLTLSVTAVVTAPSETFTLEAFAGATSSASAYGDDTEVRGTSYYAIRIA
jgi:hypothetical protein